MNTKLRCLLLDDELPGLAYLRMLCEQIPDLEVLKAYNSPAALLADHTHQVYDLCIMDIEMPELSGLDLVPVLNKPVIFVTAHKQYAADAFDLDVVDFVQKPINPDRLRKAVEKVHTRLKSGDNATKELIELYTDQGTSLIDATQIVYIRTSAIDSRDKELYLQDGSRFLLKNITFQHLATVLPSRNICRINKQEMVHVGAVLRITANRVILKNMPSSTFIPAYLNLSDSYRNDLFLRIKF